MILSARTQSALSKYEDLAVASTWGRCTRCPCGYTGEYVGGRCGDLSYANGDPDAAPCSGLVVGSDWCPVFSCIESKERWEFYCPKCFKWHSHGNESGLRVSHCRRLGVGEYYLRRVSGRKDDVKAKNVAEFAAWEDMRGKIPSDVSISVVRIKEIVGRTASALPAVPVVIEGRSHNMSAVVRVHRNDKSAVISTNAGTEQEFMAAVVPVLSVEIIGSPDLEAAMAQFLPQIVDICCKLRGYKSNVAEHRVIVAGQWLPTDVVDAFSTYRREPAAAEQA